MPAVSSGAAKRALCVAIACVAAFDSAAAQRQRLDVAGVSAWAALLQVLDQRSSDTAVVDVALASQHAALRASAARVVGMNRIASRYSHLRQLLGTDRDTAVVADAAFALGLAADTGSCGALRDALPRRAVGGAVAWSLGELGAACGSFGSLLARAHTSATRAALLQVAGRWTPFPDSIVVGATAPGTPRLERRAALYALGRARRPAGAVAGMNAARDGDPRVRELAARLLNVSIQTPADSTRVLQVLDTLLRDRVRHVRIAAVRAAASYGRAALPSFRRAWPAEHDVNVRVTLAQSIGTVAPDSSAAWSTWWSGDTTHMVRRSLIVSAWQAGAVSMLREPGAGVTTSHADYRLRIAMIEGATAAGVDRRVAFLASHVADADPRVRAAAISALAGASVPSRDSIQWGNVLATALRDTDVGVRTAALAAQRGNAAAVDVATALDGYSLALRDSSSDAREAALDLVAAAWRCDSAAFDSSILLRIQALRAPDDPLLRARVRSVTPLAFWRTAAQPTVTAAQYERIVREIVVPSLAGRPPSLRVETDRGSIRIRLDGVRSPMTTDHFLTLARRGYFRGIRFHRVVPAFVAQGGDPRGDGSGGPGFAIRDELNRTPYLRGAVGMALSGPDTGGSQFFFTLAPQPHLTGHYTVFARVAVGADVVDRLVQGDAIRNITPSTAR